MNQWFAPTQLSITFEKEGQGYFSDEQIEHIVVRNKEGKVIALKLPTKAILIANHQVGTSSYWHGKSSLYDQLDVCRLVVRVVSNIFYGNTQGRLHCSQEEPQMGTSGGLGMHFLVNGVECHTAELGAQAMQVFKFIFLARSWASDRVQLASDLSALGQQAEREDKPLTLFLYPEGTLVSKDTRPISRKFADKQGIVR
jgi:hypothetical protein